MGHKQNLVINLKLKKVLFNYYNKLIKVIKI